MKAMLVPFFLLLVGVALLLAGCQASRAGYESAPYQVVRSAGAFELRDYPALYVVETPMQPGSGADGDQGFRRLFGFITGQNSNREKIAMTTPVLISGDSDQRTMAFVLPASVQPDQAPKPADKSVRTRTLPGGRFAVMSFKGGRNVDKEKDALNRLKAWMSAERLPLLSPPVFAYFDPPWTPPFLRRNEVMLQTTNSQP